MLGALKRMVGLRAFQWYRVPRPVLQVGLGDNGEEGPEDDIWTVLKGLGTVRALDILDMDAEKQANLKVPAIVVSPTVSRSSSATTSV